MTDTFYIYDAKNYPIFEIKYEADERYRETFAEFIVRKIVSWDEDNAPCDYEDYMDIQVKWDSCAHLYHGEKGSNGRDSYFHFCGVEGFKQHCQLLEVIYKKAFEYMDREPQKDEEW